MYRPNSVISLWFLPHFTRNICKRYYSTRPSSLNDVGNNILLKGWIKSAVTENGSKILYISDGLTPKFSKVIMPEHHAFGKLPVESAVIVSGKNLFEDDDSVTVAAETVKVFRTQKSAQQISKRYNSNNVEIPIKEPHLLSNFPFFAHRIRLRAELQTLVHKYFHENKYIEVDLPIMTRTLRDSRSCPFYIESANPKNVPVDSPFGSPVYLSTNGQLHMSCFTSGLNKVYSISPSFQCGYSGGKYLCEYWTVNSEETFMESPKNGFQELMNKVEALFRRLMKEIMDTSKNYELAIEDRAVNLKIILDSDWHRVTYADAVKITVPKEEVDYALEYGMHFGFTHYNTLVKHFGGLPVFITDFPHHLKPFNVAVCQDSNKTLSFDLIFGHAGQVASGFVSETDFDRIQERLHEFGATDDYMSWFMDTRKWGTVPTRGFCFGVDRFLHLILQDSDIKNCVAFPRIKNFCSG